MKNKVNSVLAILAILSVALVGCSSEEQSAISTDGKYQYVTAEASIKAAKSGNTHIIDVRTWENYVDGRVVDSQWSPIFPLEDDNLATELEEYAKANLTDGKDIYIVCNSGKSGAEKATEVFINVGIDASSIYTVTGGADALSDAKDGLTTNRTEESIEWQYVTGKDAVASIGDENVNILDVRAVNDYSEGYLEGSMHVDLKEIEDASAQTEMYNFALSEIDEEKPDYILCYSGNSVAKTAISVMKDAGFSTENLFIIEGGAKDSDVSSALIK